MLCASIRARVCAVHGVAACHTVWREVHQHLQRVANHHVRSQATLVGNLVLARRRGLPSDIATLMLALGEFRYTALLGTRLPT